LAAREEFSAIQPVGIFARIQDRSSQTQLTYSVGSSRLIRDGGSGLSQIKTMSAGQASGMRGIGRVGPVSLQDDSAGRITISARPAEFFANLFTAI